MMRCNSLFNALLTIFFAITAFTAQAEEPVSALGLLTNETKKADRDYVSFGIALNEFRSIELVLADEFEQIRDIQFPLTAQTYGASIAYGTYITEHFKTEVRYGAGILDDTLDNALDIKLNYWFNWYIGATHPVTDYMSAYALYGVSFYDADVTRREVKRVVGGSGTTVARELTLHPSYEDMEEDLFGTSFSTSWILGIDFGLIDQWFLAFEYGRLIRDTDSNIKVYQGGAYLRYEF